MSVSSISKNVLGTTLERCSCDPVTGYFRDGFCHTDDNDLGLHVVCAIMTDEFLEYTKLQGNNLSSPTKNFSGLKAGDKWCLCAVRWLEAYKIGAAPQVILKSCHEKTLKIIPLEALKDKSFD